MKKLFIILSVILCLMVESVSANGFIPMKERINIYNGIMDLHHIEGKNFVWWECGERLSFAEGEKRAREYSDAIQVSQDYVYKKLGVRVPYLDVAAVIFQESSMNECVIGKRETRRLTEKLGRTAPS